MLMEANRIVRKAQCSMEEIRSNASRLTCKDGCITLTRRGRNFDLPVSRWVLKHCITRYTNRQDRNLFEKMLRRLLIIVRIGYGLSRQGVQQCFNKDLFCFIRHERVIYGGAIIRESQFEVVPVFYQFRMRLVTTWTSPTLFPTNYNKRHGCT